MIADIDSTLVRTLVARRQFRLNPGLYVHAAPIEPQALAKAFAAGDATEQTRALRRFYLTQIVPRLAPAGDDSEPRGALHADTEAIAALARRFRFATKVIARKRVELAPAIRAAAATGEAEAVEQALLNREVEEKVLARAHDFALREGLDETSAGELVALYRELLLPLSRLIQVYIILEAR